MGYVVAVCLLQSMLATPAYSQTDGPVPEAQPARPSIADRILRLLRSGAAAAEDPPITAARLKSAAHEHFKQAEPVKARKSLQDLLDLYRQLSAGDNSTRGRYRWSARLAEVARAHLRGGQLAEAMQVLGEAADLNLPVRSGYDNGLASAAGGVNRQLALLSADERYELLYAWTMPTKSRRTVRELSSMVPAQGPPRVFARSLGERPRTTSFPIAKTGEVSGSFSTAWKIVQSAAGKRQRPQPRRRAHRLSLNH
jgi:hypothetical protein